MKIIQIIEATLDFDDLIYLAHPYKNDKEKNMDSVNTIAGELIMKGHMIYSPLHQSHYVNQLINHPEHFWYDYDLRILKRCDVLLLCPGWKESDGCRLEFSKALQLGLKIFEVEAE